MSFGWGDLAVVAGTSMLWAAWTYLAAPRIQRYRQKRGLSRRWWGG